MVLDDVIDAGASGAAAKAGAEFVKILRPAGGDNLHVSVFGVADPATQVKFAGFAMDEPAKTDSLNPAADEKMKDHLLVSLQKPAGDGADAMRS